MEILFFFLDSELFTMKSSSFVKYPLKSYCCHMSCEGIPLGENSICRINYPPTQYREAHRARASVVHSFPFLRSLTGYSTSFLFLFRFSFYILRSIRELLWLYQSGYLVSSAHAQSISISCMPFQYVIGISYIWCTCLRSYSVVQIFNFFLNFNFCKPEYI